MTTRTYDSVVARNIRSARAAAGLGQVAVSARMRVLGHVWRHQTVGLVERGERRVTTGELLGLALALEVTLPMLLTASDQDGEIETPGGQRLGATSVKRLAGHGSNDRAVEWDGNTVKAVTVFPQVWGEAS